MAWKQIRACSSKRYESNVLKFFCNSQIYLCQKRAEIKRKKEREGEKRIENEEEKEEKRGNKVKKSKKKMKEKVVHIAIWCSWCGCIEIATKSVITSSAE